MIFRYTVLRGIRFIKEVISFFICMPDRISNERTKQSYYLKIKQNILPKRIEIFNLPFCNPLSTWPGHHELLPWNDKTNWDIPELKSAFFNALEHKFKLLSEDYVLVNERNISYANEMKTFAIVLGNRNIQNYKQIDWHTDFKSGYKWDRDCFYFDIKVAPILGADIKVPRELSRFQHIGILALSDKNIGSIEFLLQVSDWIVSNRYGYGVNWACTMDVSLRVINWIWGICFFKPEVEKYPDLYYKIVQSIYEHGIHIENNLEYYKSSTGNHYLSNIAGLIYIACAFPEFPESDRWLLFGLQELNSEMKREVYFDGASHEGSTNYHRLVAELFASCTALVERLSIERKNRLKSINVKQHTVRPFLRESSKFLFNLDEGGPIMPIFYYSRLSRMADFTESLIKPNGFVPQIGDNDSARAHKLYPSVNENVNDHRHLVSLIRSLLCQKSYSNLGNQFEAELISGSINLKTSVKPAPENNSVHHKDSGIAILKNQDVFLVVSCGQNGQNGRGGHNHNDKLSFELNIKGLDFIVDGGCPVYTANPQMRNRYRGTGAHSTIMVGDEEQDKWSNTMHGLFVLRDRSFPRMQVRGNKIRGEHVGYSVKHQRQFCLGNSELEIFDSIKVFGKRKINFNLHPDVNCEIESEVNDEVYCTLKHNLGCEIKIHIAGAINPQIGEGCFSLGYGIPVPAKNLSVHMTGISASTKIVW